jgi:hypothetical protein
LPRPARPLWHPRLQVALSSWRSETLPDGSGCDSSDCAYCQALARLRQPGGQSAPAGCWLRRKRSRTDLSTMAEAAPTSSGDGQQEPAALSRVPSGTLAATDVAPAGQLLGSMWDHALFVEAPAARCSSPAGPAAAAETAETAGATLAAEMATVRQASTAGPALAAEQATVQQALTAGPPADTAGRCRSPAPTTAVVAVEPPPRHCRRTSSSSGAGLAFVTEDSSSGEDGGATSSGRLGGGGAAWSPAWHAPASLHEVAAFVPPGPYRQRQDIVCALEFEEHGWLLATAGVSKQARLACLAACAAPAASRGRRWLRASSVHVPNPRCRNHAADQSVPLRWAVLCRFGCIRWPRRCSTPRTHPSVSPSAASAWPPSSAAWPGTRTRLGRSRVRAPPAVPAACPCLGTASRRVSSCFRLVATMRGGLPPAAPRLASLTWPPTAFSTERADLAATLRPPPAVADYDGVVSQVDMETGHLIAEADEHCGRRCGPWGGSPVGWPGGGVACG